MPDQIKGLIGITESCANPLFPCHDTDHLKCLDYTGFFLNISWIFSQFKGFCIQLHPSENDENKEPVKCSFTPPAMAVAKR